MFAAAVAASAPVARGAPLLTRLPDECLESVLGFVLPALWELPAVVGAARRLREAAAAPGVWRGAVVALPRAALEQFAPQAVALAARCLSCASEVRLPAGAGRTALQAQLSEVCPRLPMSVAAEGPVMLFIMWADIVIGQVIELRLFEPRYRWMCERLLTSSVGCRIGFVTHGFLMHARTGACGYLCDVLAIARQRSGDFTCRVRIGSFCKVAEAWAEEVPESQEAAPLYTAYLDVVPVGLKVASPEASQQYGGFPDGDRAFVIEEHR